MTPRPGDSLLEFLVKLGGRIGRGASVDGDIADLLRGYATMRREEADALDRLARRARGEAAQHLEDEELVDEIVRRLQPAYERTTQAAAPDPGPPRPARRPRLEESTDPSDRERATRTVELLRLHPGWTDNAVAKSAGVSRDVVARLRGKRAENAAENPAEKSVRGG